MVTYWFLYGEGKKIWLLDWLCIQIHEFLYASFLSEYGDIYHEYAIRIIYITTKIGLWFIIDVSCPPLTWHNFWLLWWTGIHLAVLAWTNPSYLLGCQLLEKTWKYLGIWQLSRKCHGIDQMSGKSRRGILSIAFFKFTTMSMFIRLFWHIAILKRIFLFVPVS